LVADFAAVGKHGKGSVVPPPISTRHTPSSLLILGQYAKTRGQLLEHDVLHREPAALMHFSMFCAALSAR